MRYSIWPNGLIILFMSVGPLAEAQYLKVSNTGVALTDSTALGTTANDWACTYDSDTKLIWEVKTADKGLRDKSWTYSWFDSRSPAGQQGVSSGSSKCQTIGRCDTDKFVQDVNQKSLCGANDWRLASIEELRQLVRCSGQTLSESDFACQGSYVSPTVDKAYFPNSTATWSWSSTAYTDDSNLPIWYVNFEDGGRSFAYKLNNGSVRLVRSGRPFAANAASYDPKAGRLSLSAVQVGGVTYSAELQDRGGYQFQLLKAEPLANDQTLQLPEYSTVNGLLTIPYLSVFNKGYQIRLQNNNGIFVVTQANPL